MIELTTQQCIGFLGLFLFLLCGIASFFFGRISVKYIEGEMAKAGKRPPLWDKGIGARVAVYATVILFPKIKRHASLVDVESTIRYARKVDWYLALLFEVTFYGFLIVAGVFYYLYAP